MECACGCGGQPVNGKFLPGHDQRLRAYLERRVGGLIQLVRAPVNSSTLGHFYSV